MLRMLFLIALITLSAMEANGDDSGFLDKDRYAKAASEYKDVSKEASDLVKAVRRIQAVLNGGPTYKEFRGALKPIAADVEVFCESKDARKRWPALAFSLSNATDCFQKYLRVWQECIFANDLEDRLNAELLKASCDKILLPAAEASIAAAQSLTSDEDEKITKTLRVLDEKRDLIRSDAAFVGAQKLVADARRSADEKRQKKEAKKTPEVTIAEKALQKARVELVNVKNIPVTTQSSSVRSIAFKSNGEKNQAIRRREIAVEKAQKNLDLAKEKAKSSTDTAR